MKELDEFLKFGDCLGNYRITTNDMITFCRMI